MIPGIKLKMAKASSVVNYKMSYHLSIIQMNKSIYLFPTHLLIVPHDIYFLVLFGFFLDYPLNVPAPDEVVLIAYDNL